MKNKKELLSICYSNLVSVEKGVKQRKNKKEPFVNPPNIYLDSFATDKSCVY